MKDDLDLDEFTELQSDALAQLTVRAHPGRFSVLRVSHRKSVLYGAFVWARRAVNSPKTAISGPGRR
jgi:hypothetical protein